MQTSQGLAQKHASHCAGSTCLCVAVVLAAKGLSQPNDSVQAGAANMDRGGKRMIMLTKYKADSCPAGVPTRHCSLAALALSAGGRIARQSWHGCTV